MHLNLVSQFLTIFRTNYSNWLTFNIIKKFQAMLVVEKIMSVLLSPHLQVARIIEQIHRLGDGFIDLNTVSSYNRLLYNKLYFGNDIYIFIQQIIFRKIYTYIMVLHKEIYTSKYILNLFPWHLRRNKFLYTLSPPQKPQIKCRPA